MKTILFSAAFSLVLASLAFADGGWDYSKHNSREALIFSGNVDGANMLADTSAQNSKAALVAVSSGSAKQTGTTTIVYASKGSDHRTATVAVTR